VASLRSHDLTLFVMRHFVEGASDYPLSTRCCQPPPSAIALLNITKSLANEFGADGVHVSAVCPGWVDTNLWQRNAQGLAPELTVKSEEEARGIAARRNSLNRFGKFEELPNAIVFLCSEHASYITGVSLNLDGGRLKGLW